MGKRNAAAAIVDADRLQPFETPPKRMKHGPAAAATTSVTSPPTTATTEAPYSPNISASEFTLSKEFVDGTLLMDLTLKQWRTGKPIGKGSFGEIFLASDDIDTPVTSENAKYVVKIEPHSNGPLFVEIHCLLNTAKRTETCIIPPGMPEYIASGSHMFKNERYRFLILKRYQRDLHSLIKNKRVNPKSIPVIACQILDVLEHLHDQGYVHSDIKAENLMIGTVEGATQNGATNRLSNGQNGTEDQYQPNPPNGATLPEGKVAKRGMKTSAEHHHQQVNGSGAALQENGLYFHQERELCTRTRNLRPLKTVTYRDLSDEDDRSASAVRSRGNLPRKRGRRRQDDASFRYSISPRRSGYEELRAATEVAHWQELKRATQPKPAVEDPAPPEDRIHLIDFGLASKFVDSSGQHRPFCMDQRRAHDGTLEFTSRDAHMGAHARRSDLECLGYNLVYWCRGFLPWKDEKLLNQPEQVHRMKEYFMTDVREMLRLIYGEDCPGYLGDFLAYVGNLTYDERPDYQYCKSLFCKELKRLGCPVSRTQPLRLDVSAIVQLSIPLTAQDEAEITNKINHVKSLMKLGALIPYRESTLHSKASSPKNLRSKRSDANGKNSLPPTATTVTDGGSVSVPNAANTAGSTICTRKKEKQFSCEEIFATDADQIARERVEKEFERAEQMEETVIRYTGKPTYAIQELLERKSRGHSLGGSLEYTESEGYIKGYTKPMMDILRKRQSQLFQQIVENNTTEKSNEVVNKTKGKAVKKESASDSENAPMEQNSDRKSEDDAEEEEVDVAMATPDYEDEDDVSVKLSKYEQDDDYELASEDEDEEDLLEDDDEKEVASSEVDDEEEEEDEEVDEEEDVEDEEEEANEDYGEEQEVEEESVVQNGYESRGSHRRKKESKSRKKEDTDSDFINDGGCEVEGTDLSNLPDGEDPVEEENVEEEELQDSDFNDQDSTATGSDVVVPDERPPKRKPGRPPKKQGSDRGSNGRKSVKGRGGKVSSSKKEATMSSMVGTHDNEEEASDDPAVTDRYSEKMHHVTKRRSGGHRKKRQKVQVLDDGDGDNARLFEDQHETGSQMVDDRETVQKQRHHHYNNNNHCNSKAYYGDVDDSSHDMAPHNSTVGGDGAFDRNASKYRYVKRRKSGLRERIRPTDRGTDYADNMQRKRKAALQNKRRRESAALHGEMDGGPVDGSVGEEDYSCSSSTSSSSSGSSSSSSRGSTSHSVSSSCISNRSRMVSHCSSAASLDSASLVSSQIRRGRKRKHVATVSSRDSSGTRQSTAQCPTTAVRSRKKRATVTDNDTGHSNSRWSPSNSNGSQSAATSRSSSVSASGNVVPQRLATLPEHHRDDEFVEEDDGDDTRDVDYSPICTRRRRKATVGTEATNGTISRKTSTASTAVRKRNDSKGVIGKGTGAAPSSSSSASSGSAVDGGGISLPPAYGSSSSIQRRLDIIQPPPPAPVAAAALIQHHHQQQQQQHRIRRPQHHMAYQNYYRVNDQHHLPSTMLVRTYSRG